MKWGEYSSDVQFILQRSEPAAVKMDAATATKSPPSSKRTSSSPPAAVHISDRKQSPSLKSFDVTGYKPENVVSVVREPPQLSPPSDRTEGTTGSRQASVSPNLLSSQKYSMLEFNSADVRNSLDRKTAAASSTAGDQTAAQRLSSGGGGGDSSEIVYKTGPPISSNGALVPPPYRDPPPPRTSPLHSIGGSDRIAEFKVSECNTFVLLNLNYLPLTGQRFKSYRQYARVKRSDK